MKFHLDENIPHALAIALRSHGFDVTTPSDVNLMEASDEVHLRFAASEGRVIITHDRDYVSPKFSHSKHAGIGYCHQQKYAIGQLLMMCLLLDQYYGDTGMRGQVEYL